MNMRSILFRFKNIPLALGSLVLFLLSCKGKVNELPCSPLSGRFINKTVLDKCPEMMPSDVPHFCFEIKFRGTDSVDINNGFEKFSLPLSRSGDGCEYIIHGASLFGDMVLIPEGDTSFRLVDTMWTKIPAPSLFQKIKSANGDAGFESLMNECLVAGEYALFDKGDLRPRQVTFMSNGQLYGFHPYLGYSICYAGDCLEETEPPARTIDLFGSSGERATFVFKGVEGKMALELYSIGPPVQDIKGGRTIGPMVYELRTE